MAAAVLGCRILGVDKSKRWLLVKIIMLAQFKDDFFWMLRESKGYFPWLSGHPYRLHRFMWKELPFKPCLELKTYCSIQSVLEQEYSSNLILDLFFKALVRAEIRFISRYVPQRSHEERLTGHLVSEIDGALCLVKNDFKEQSNALYGEYKNLDFLYYDLSRGGRVERHTGADLGFILVVDLPDYPFLVKSVILQAKKLHGSAQIKISQHRSLLEHGEDNVAYIFYDTDLKTLASPMVLKLNDYDLVQSFNKAEENGQASFTINFQQIMDGLPLSLFMIDEFMDFTRGMRHASFDDAFRYFMTQVTVDQEPFRGILAIVSLGRAIRFTQDEETGLRITV